MLPREPPGFIIIIKYISRYLLFSFSSVSLLRVKKVRVQGHSVKIYNQAMLHLVLRAHVVIVVIIVVDSARHHEGREVDSGVHPIHRLSVSTQILV